MNNISLFISGNLGFTIVKHLIKKSKYYIVNAIFTNAESFEIIDYANNNKIPIFIGNPRTKQGAAFIINHKITCDILLSINYLFILDQSLLSLPWKYAINFHGALLPKYRGRTPHVWAIINGETETGITAHFISEQCDEGDIIFQEKISINDEDTGADILKTFEHLYPIIVDKVLEMISSNHITRIPQNNLVSSYYGKRTPVDGRINWEWFSNRICNWVRAQAYPYPGAYTYYENQKITIDKVKIVESFPFSNEYPNGYILKGGHSPYIKVPNGIIEIVTVREKKSFLKGKYLE